MKALGLDGGLRLVDRLVAHGWVRRQRLSEDRRRVQCTITPRGSELLQEIDPEIERADDALGGILSSEELARLVQMLDRLREALAEKS